MIDYNILILEKSNKNKVKVKHLNLDHKLDFFLLIDSNDINYIDSLETKIIDLVIDNISKEETYKDFSKILEKINIFLREYYKNKSSLNYLNILIAIQNKQDFIFSQVWKPSLYLVKTNWETIEITDKNAKNKEFNYISEWILENKDILILSTKRLLKYLSYSDFVDASMIEIPEKINKNIEIILNEEKIEDNIWLLTIKYILKQEKNEKKFLKELENLYLKAIDNNFIKLSLAYLKLIQEKLAKKSKLIRNIIILSILIVSSLSLFFVLSKTISKTNIVNQKINYKQQLEQAKKYKIIASNNYSNPEVFELNIKNAEDIIKTLKEKKLFLNDIALLEQDLNDIKKAFNGIETFSENQKNTIYKLPKDLKSQVIKTLNISWKNYIVTKNWVIWPILKNIEPKINNFDKIWDDYFIDATPLNNSIIILTKKWKIIEFNKALYFSFKDVIWQDTWEKADKILNYWHKIYLIDSNNAQIYKHTIYWKWFNKAVTYLKPEDQKYIWKIEDIAIDWWFYILKWDLKFLKFFSNPYRLETINLNKIPKNYTKEKDSKINLYTRKDLNYVYMLLNNKIWIFKPNTRFYKKTKFLTYMWQIEATNNNIIDFYVNKDWVINILTNSWLYLINFSENDWKILISN